MLQKLRTVIYHTNDLAAAKDWYTSLTGKEPYFDEVFYVGFDKKIEILEELYELK